MSDLIRFTPRPRVEETRRSYPIIRCDKSAKYKLNFYVLSNDVYGLYIHYAGKSVPCSSHLGNCKWCDLNRAARWVGYVPATDHARQRLFLVELTPGVMPIVESYLKNFQTLRGSYMTLNRPSMRDTGRLDLTILPLSGGLSPGDLPPPFAVADVLEKIFGVVRQPEDLYAKKSEVHDPGQPVEAQPTMDEIVCRRTDSFGTLSPRSVEKAYEGNGRAPSPTLPLD